jgi:predicted amidohydrolase
MLGGRYILISHELVTYKTNCHRMLYLLLGVHNDKRESYGYSLAINAWGDCIIIVGSCGNETEHIVIATYDKSQQEEIRSRMNIQVSADGVPLLHIECVMSQ